jgi:hypothetical protein
MRVKVPYEAPGWSGMENVVVGELEGREESGETGKNPGDA